ncbi:MAG: V-type ATPase subunit [Trueperaceae bacterium]|nr:MAG: V-type ATPase subunit [Trueperaceae bacterium]
MPRDFGYINARIHGLRSRLLGQDFYSEALNATDFKAYTSILAQTPYLPEVEEAQSRFQGIKIVDQAVGRNFYKTARSILNFSEGRAGELISLLLLRYDLNNIKAITRAKHSGRSTVDIEAGLLPAGSLKPAVLEAVASAPDIGGVAQALLITKTPLKGAFFAAAMRYSSDGDLYLLELALDKAYFKIIFKSLKELRAPKRFFRLAKREVDATNLTTALSVRSGSGLTEGLFVGGGLEIGRSAFETLASDTSSSAFQVLSGTSFAGVADAASLSEAETLIRAVMAGHARGLAADALNIGLAANYLRLKEAEVAKLRLLARGKYYGVAREVLAKELGDA